MSEFPSVQGRFPSWGSIELKLDKVLYTGATGIKWDYSLTPTKVYGVGSKAKGGTLGKHECSGSLEMLLPAWQAFRKQLADKHPNRSFGLVEFEINVAWRETDLDKVQTANLHRVRVMKAATDNAEGPDPTKVSIDLFVLDIDEDSDSILSAADG
jgi:hypothetical protein